MNTQTRRYRKSELADLKPTDTYKASVILSDCLGNKTKTISITVDEFYKITKLLTGKA